MFKIVKFPSGLESFFCSLKSRFHWNHFDYFRLFVLAIAFSWGRRNVSEIVRHLSVSGMHHRTRFNNFLAVVRWEPEEALAQKAYELIALLNPRKGETLNLIIDDSGKEKCGKHMDAVHLMHDHAKKRFVRGVKFVNAAVHFRGQTIPLAIRIYVKQEDCSGLGVEFVKTTQIAAKIIRKFNPPEGVKVLVLFDSFYLCPAVMCACRDKGFRFISTAKSNRNLYKNGRKLKAGKYGANLFSREPKRKLAIEKRSGRAEYRYIDAGLFDFGKAGRLRVVYSRKNSEKNIATLVTDDAEISAEKIVREYDGRWSIEVFFRDSKQILGLGQYQNRGYAAAVTHLHLVCFAYALLTHIAIMADCAQGKKKTKSAKKSTGDLQNELRRIVWDELAEHLKGLPSGNQVVKELERLFIAA